MNLSILLRNFYSLFFDVLSKSLSQSELRENAADNSNIQDSLKLLYNSQSLADLLEIDVRTLHKLRNKGRIGYIKHDGKYIYSREDEVNYIKDNHIDPLKT